MKKMEVENLVRLSLKYSNNIFNPWIHRELLKSFDVF
jgi:hypothetical protein